MKDLKDYSVDEIYAELRRRNAEDRVNKYDPNFYRTLVSDRGLTSENIWFLISEEKPHFEGSYYQFRCFVKIEGVDKTLNSYYDFPSEWEIEDAKASDTLDCLHSYDGKYITQEEIADLIPDFLAENSESIYELAQNMDLGYTLTLLSQSGYKLQSHDKDISTLIHTIPTNP